MVTLLCGCRARPEASKAQRRRAPRPDRWQVQPSHLGLVHALPFYLDSASGNTESQEVRCSDEAFQTCKLRALQVHVWTADHAHRPHITAKRRLRKAKTLGELHDGGRSRRERALVRPPGQLGSMEHIS